MRDVSRGSRDGAGGDSSVVGEGELARSNDAGGIANIQGRGDFVSNQEVEEIDVSVCGNATTDVVVATSESTVQDKDAEVLGDVEWRWASATN